MRNKAIVLLLLIAAAVPASAELQLFPETGHLQFTNARQSQQLIITAKDGDATGRVAYHVEPEGIVVVSATGLVTPVSDGRAIIFIIESGTQETTDLPVLVSGMREETEVSFRHEMIPVLTKYGCNGGGCHGKAGGQNGFRLSLLGYEPWNDYDFLVREGRGRRISPAAPEYSLLLQKASGGIPHEGGARLKPQSDHYQLVADWIRQGMPDTPSEDIDATHIEVFPKDRVVQPGSTQQLAVTAFFSDGTSRDITTISLYESNQEDMSSVTEDGLVTFEDRSGTASIMVRFQEKVAVFRATIPLGEEIETLPAPSNFIDKLIFSKLELLGLPPSGICDDATFLRRVTLDIAGRLPTSGEVEAFLEKKDQNRRSLKIDELLESRDYADFFAQKWAGILRNKRSRDEYIRGTFAFHDWVRESLVENKPYDQFVTELLTATGEIGRNPAVAWYRSVSDPKDQMQDVAQVFLGIRMQCAQCHHHPYEIWSQDDYYSFTAFFSTLGRKAGEQPQEEILFPRRTVAQLQNPNTGVMMKPTPLGGEPFEVATSEDPRRLLANWMTDPENPWFSRMIANRYWKHFLGKGLVEPEDDLRVTNPPTNPELLDALAGHFVKSGFDLKSLVRTICSSRVYQLEAESNRHNLTDTQNFSRFYPRRIPAEVLLDSINTVTGFKTSFQGQPPGVRAIQLPDEKFNSQSFFLSVFGRPENSSACECERVSDANLAQSLHLINSASVQEKLTSEKGTAARLAAEPEIPLEDRITRLYLEALNRPPNENELGLAMSHVQKKRQQPIPDSTEKSADQSGEKEAFEDLLWALLNTKEFLFNH